MKPRLPPTWNFAVRPHLSFAKAEGLSLETRCLDGRYYRAELLVVESDTTTKRSWRDGLWCYRDTEESAIAAVEQLAVAAGLVEAR